MSYIFTSEKMRNMVAAVMLAFAGVASAADYVATPANNAEVASLTTIAVEFTGVETVAETYSAFPTVSNGTQNFRNGTSISGNVYTVELREATPAGAYTLTIPANAITLDGVALDETITLHYTVASSATGYTHMTVNPAEGRVTEVNAITVTLEGATTASYIANSTETATHLTRNGEQIVTFMPFNTVIQGNTLTFTPWGPQTESGEYKLVIPANSIAADGTAVEATTFTYTIFVPEVTATPTPGAVTSLSQVDFTFAGVTELVENNYSGVSFTDAAGNAVRYVTSISGNVFTVRPIDTPAAGEYTVTVAPGTIICDGTSYDREITATYTVTPEAPEFTATPSIANGAEVFGFSSMAITFDGVTTLASTIDSTEKCPYITDGEGNRIRTITSTPIEGNVMTITPYEAITEAGTYTLTVPGIGYTVDGAVGRDLTFTFSVKAVNFTVTPAEAVNALSAMSFTFADYTAVSEVGYDVMLRDAAGNAIRVRSSVEGNVYTVNAIDTITAAGNYTLTIPANTIALDGVTYPVAISQVFTVAAPEINVVATPAAGAEVFVLSGVTLTFEGATTVASTIDATEKCPYIVNGKGDRITTITSPKIDGNVMVVAPYMPIAEAGEYTVVIPGIGYTVDGVAGTDLSYTYNVKGLYYTMEPKAGKVTSIENIDITFDEVKWVDEAGYKTTITDAKGNGFRVLTGAKGNTYRISLLDGAIKEAGEYYLHIPAGTLNLGGTILDVDIDETFVVEAGSTAEFNWTVSPENGATVNELMSMTFTIEDATTIELPEMNPGNAPYIIDLIQGTFMGYYNMATTSENTVTFSRMSAMAQPGVYNVFVPQGAFYVDGVENQEIVVLYVVSANQEGGVEGVIIDGTTAPVYNLQGVLVAPAADAAAIKALPRGIYIINGRKVRI